MYVRHDLLKQQYPYENVLGKGAYGNVYASKDVVVKVQKINSVGYENFIPELACYQRFHHPGMCRLIAWSISDTDLHLVVERGVQLQSAYYNNLITDRMILTHILSCLCFLGDNEIIHNDIKPTNIIVREGYARLIDFGLSTVGIRGAKDVYFQRPVYTKGFFDPQAMGGEYNSIRTDLYALGKTLEFIDEDIFQGIIQECLKFPYTDRLTCREILSKYNLTEIHGDINMYQIPDTIFPVSRDILTYILKTGAEGNVSSRVVCLAAHNLYISGLEATPSLALASLYIADCLAGIGSIKLTKPMYTDINHLLMVFNGNILNTSVWDSAADIDEMVTGYWNYSTLDINLLGVTPSVNNIIKNITAEQMVENNLTLASEPPVVRPDWLKYIYTHLGSIYEYPQIVLYYYPQIQNLSIDESIKLYQTLLGNTGGRTCLSKMCPYSINKYTGTYFVKQRLNPFTFTPESPTSSSS
jgi:serine/threonine protein kinase